MHGLVCDACGDTLLLESDVRYVVRIEGFAAYDPMELSRQDLSRDLDAEMRRLLQDLEKLSTDSAQDQVHRVYAYDLCPQCWALLRTDPIAGLKAKVLEQRKKSQGD